MHTGTPITEDDGSNFVFAMAPLGADLVCIKTRNTGNIEITTLTSDSNYQQRTLLYDTPIAGADGNNFVFPSPNGPLPPS